MHLSSSATSLSEIHSSVATAHTSFWRRLFAFSGPAYLVSVGYMDPGNWATDLEGGARFGYRLLWVLVVSNLLAILLQTLSARLGIVSRRDLAQVCRETYPRAVSNVLWGLCEIAIAACDLAEVIGAAIALQLLFGIPLLAGVIVTSLDTLLLLWFAQAGIRAIESIVLVLITTIAVCFGIELFWVHPSAVQLARGLIPHLNGSSLYVAIAILGATVMPHNLYLHSALVQTREIGNSERELRSACRFNLLDCSVAMNGAMLVNIGILVLSAGVFFTRGIVVTEITQAQQLLSPLLGTAMAGILFGVALLCSGQSSTITGTMAGQVVMEGFLNLRIRPWLRRLVTRLAAIIPAALTVYFAGQNGTFRLLILSQVILSLQLPFAIIPLLHATGNLQRMGPFVNARWVKVLAWPSAAVIVILNAWIVQQAVAEWLAAAGAWRLALEFLIVPAIIGVGGLLVYIALAPIFTKQTQRAGAALDIPASAPPELPEPAYRKILVPLDHTPSDREALAHASSIARGQHARIYLLHLEEGVTSQMYGADASTAEVTEGEAYLRDVAGHFVAQGIPVEVAVRHGRSARDAIVAFSQEIGPDLIVMAAHGHKGLKDMVFGSTINAVRHRVNIPVLVVREYRAG